MSIKTRASFSNHKGSINLSALPFQALESPAVEIELQTKNNEPGTNASNRTSSEEPLHVQDTYLDGGYGWVITGCEPMTFSPDTDRNLTSILPSGFRPVFPLCRDPIRLGSHPSRTIESRTGQLLTVELDRFGFHGRHCWGMSTRSPTFLRQTTRADS
jgi:hypothetical protein